MSKHVEVQVLRLRLVRVIICATRVGAMRSPELAQWTGTLAQGLVILSSTMLWCERTRCSWQENGVFQKCSDDEVHAKRFACIILLHSLVLPLILFLGFRVYVARPMFTDLFLHVRTGIISAVHPAEISKSELLAFPGLSAPGLP